MGTTRSSFRLSAFPVTIFAHLLGIAVATIVLVWLIHFRQGFAFNSDDKQKIFNLHPLLMVLGFILLTGEAIMAYKTVPAKRENQKLFHLVLHFIALLAGIFGIYAVFKFHNERHIPNMYTLHSWLGISTISLFALQWILGFFSFFFPGAESSARARLAPWHVFLGVVIFFMAILSAETGLVERFTFLGLETRSRSINNQFYWTVIAPIRHIRLPRCYPTQAQFLS